MKIFSLILWISWAFFSTASDTQAVQNILQNYQSKQTITMNFHKTFTHSLLNKQTQSFGKFYLSGNLWRLEVLSPQKSYIISNTQGVLVFSADKSLLRKTKKSSLDILALLFNKKKFNQTFQYKEKKKKGRTWIYIFLSSALSRIDSIALQVEKDRILSLRITRPSSLGEEFYRFSEIRFNDPLSPDLFLRP